MCVCVFTFESENTDSSCLVNLPNCLALFSQPACCPTHARSLSLYCYVTTLALIRTRALLSSTQHDVYAACAVCVCGLCFVVLSSYAISCICWHTHRDRKTDTHTRTVTRSTCSFLPLLFAFAPNKFPLLWNSLPISHDQRVHRFCYCSCSCHCPPALAVATTPEGAAASEAALKMPSLICSQTK